MAATRPKYYEFFAGGGMARAGLGTRWDCEFANDFDPMKAAVYKANWGSDHLLCEDVGRVAASTLPGIADLAWASFPCQDLSLAGAYLGLGSAASDVLTRSGTFWPFWALMNALKKEQRAPRMIVLENVRGVLTSRNGKDFAAICSAVCDAGYQIGALMIDAALFVPQSRQRIFFVAVKLGGMDPSALCSPGPTQPWHPPALVSACERLPASVKRNFLWWNPPLPQGVRAKLVDVIEDFPAGVQWHKPAETQKLLAMMSPLNRAKVKAAQTSGAKAVGCLYKRTRPDADGVRRQMAEVRFDNIAGCLRTPGGGSSRQTILIVQGKSVRSRLLSPREAARLMGLPDDFKIPERYNDAYHVAGDGVCVPVVRHLAKTILEPLLESRNQHVTLNAAE